MEKKGCIIFDSNEFGVMTAGLKLAQCMSKGLGLSVDPDTVSETVARQLEDLVIADAHSCSCCSVKFLDATAQRAHFKLDWHRYNIKRQLAGLPTIREEAFTCIADKAEDIESISGSESESEDESQKSKESEISEPKSNRHAKVFFKNNAGQIISLFRCLLFSSKDYPESESVFVNAALQATIRDKWAIVMLGGGHFAACVFKGQEPLVHKTFHCYTVRAKQGGSQGARDNRGGSHPKSAGASLRRYNEQALVQHVQDLISTWVDHLGTCDLILYRAVGPHNRSVLFGGKTPPFDKSDPRLRTIPFPTRRATFSEVKRVHGILSFLEVHGLETEFESKYPPSPERKYVAGKEDKTEGEASKEVSPRRGKTKAGVKPNRAKSRPSPDRPLPVTLSHTSSESEAVSGSEMILTFEDVGIKFGDNVEDFDKLVKNEMKKKKKEKAKPLSVQEPSTSAYDYRSKEEKEKEEKLMALEAERKRKIAEKKARKQAASLLRQQLEEEEAATNPVLIFQKKILAAIQSSDVSKLQLCLSNEFIQTLPSKLPGGLENVINLPLLEGNTALHLASKSTEPTMISELMNSGADPTVWNKKSQPPYAVASNKDIRKAFQDYRIQQPVKYDYSKSQIPLPLTEEEEREVAARKAAQRKAKREKEKQKQKTKAEEKAELEEKARFMAMSDREKRALAAERRMLAAQRRGTVDESKHLVLMRCFLCGSDVSGLATFEYNQYKFCSIECLKGHRKMMNPESS